MDRRQARRCTLIGAALALLLAAASDAPSLPIREARWLNPPSLFTALTREPSECLVSPDGAGERRSVAIGRTAFRTPLLLGGQAGRAGMSCATCHRNGRDNPDFLLGGLSGAPGTADVTSSLMSSHRGDRVANPTPIPDLGGPREALKVRHVDLQRFIHGLIVEEFDGPEPSPEVLAGLADYVRALRPEGCTSEDRPIRLADRLHDVEEAVRLARITSGETRRLLIAAARSTLELVDERFRLPGLEAERGLLAASDHDLLVLRGEGRGFQGWSRRWPATKRKLLSRERESLFNPARLRRAMMSSRAGSGPNGAVPLSVPWKPQPLNHPNLGAHRP